VGRHGCEPRMRPDDGRVLGLSPPSHDTRSRSQSHPPNQSQTWLSWPPAALPRETRQEVQREPHLHLRRGCHSNGHLRVQPRLCRHLVGLEAFYLRGVHTRTYLREGWQPRRPTPRTFDVHPGAMSDPILVRSSCPVVRSFASQPQNFIQLELNSCGNCWITDGW